MPDSSARSLAPLLALLANGGQPARSALLKHAEARVRYHTQCMLRQFPSVRRWEATSDVFQNVSLRLDRALQVVTLTEPHEFLALAAESIRRELLDLLRHYKVKNAALKAQQSAAGARSGKTDLAQLEERSDPRADPISLDVWHHFHAEIDRLPEGMRRLFDLLYYQGMSQIEAAGVLGISERTLRRKWAAAQLRVMEIVGDDVPDF